MECPNNLKIIRELYGATQDEIAKALNVNRATVSQWETGAIKASNVNLEKLSLFYGIGPECFYELPEIDNIRKELILASAKKAKEVIARSKERDKAADLNNLFVNTSFVDARKNFMFSMKVLLATADQGKLDDLKLAYEINQKMATRLNAIIRIREDEEKEKKEKNKDTLYDILDALSED